LLLIFILLFSCRQMVSIRSCIPTATSTPDDANVCEITDCSCIISFNTAALFILFEKNKSSWFSKLFISFYVLQVQVNFPLFISSLIFPNQGSQYSYYTHEIWMCISQFKNHCLEEHRWFKFTIVGCNSILFTKVKEMMRIECGYNEEMPLELNLVEDLSYIWPCMQDLPEFCCYMY